LNLRWSLVFDVVNTKPEEIITPSLCNNDHHGVGGFVVFPLKVLMGVWELRCLGVEKKLENIENEEKTGRIMGLYSEK